MAKQANKISLGSTHLFLQWAKQSSQALSGYGNLIDGAFLSQGIEENILHVSIGTLKLTLYGIPLSLECGWSEAG